MWYAVEHEGLGGLLESYAFIEPFGILLSLNIYTCCVEILNRCINGMKHDLLAIAFASLSGDNPPDGDFLHVSPCRTYTSQSNYLVCNSQPQMNRLLVITVHILIDAVLLDHKHLATNSQQFVKFIYRQLLE